MTITPEWAALIARYEAVKSSAGHLATTKGSRRQHLQYLARRIGLQLPDITGEDLVIWTGEQAWARETRRGRYNTYRSFWRWAVMAGHTTIDAPASLEKVRTYRKKSRPVPEEIYGRAMMKADTRTQLILRLAKEHGLRRGEIAVVHVRDMVKDLVGWSLIVQGKGEKERIVPLSNPVAQAMIDRAEGGYVFRGDIQGHLSPRRVGELAVDVLEDGWTLHRLRDRFATNLWAEDPDLFLLQDQLGHASAETSRGYVSIEEARARRAVLRAAGSVSA